MALMNPDILNAVQKLPLEIRGQLLTILLQRLNEDNPKVPEMLKPIVKRAFEKPRDTKLQRAEKFSRCLDIYRGEHNFASMDRFEEYWTEGLNNPKARKLRFEKQKTFDIKRRLATWAKNDKKFNKGVAVKDFQDIDYES
jgi:hypothetical protein